MFTAKFGYRGAWQISRCYQREPGMESQACMKVLRFYKIVEGLTSADVVV